MPNPDGFNAYGGPLEREAPYGAIERMKNLQRVAPVTTPHGNAPRRSQRRATRGQRQPQAQARPLPPVQPQVPYESIVAQFWQQLAAEPGASELVRQIAAEASGG